MPNKVKANFSDGNNSISVSLSLIVFEEDGVHAVYSPALDLFGYGKNQQEAKESFEIALEEFLLYTTAKGTFLEELKNHGWQVTGKPKEHKYVAPAMEEMIASNDLLAGIMNTKDFFKTTRNVLMPA